MVLLSVLLSISLIINKIDSLIPLINIAAGVRIGLANIITLLVLYMFSFKEAFLLTILRVLISGLLIGGASSFLYSLSGGVLSVIFMYLFKKIFKNNISEIGVSVIGAFMHNTGQILIMMLLTKSIRVPLNYYPVILYISIITGISIGFISKKILLHYNKILKFVS